MSASCLRTGASVRVGPGGWRLRAGSSVLTDPESDSASPPGGQALFPGSGWSCPSSQGTSRCGSDAAFRWGPCRGRRVWVRGLDPAPISGAVFVDHKE